MRFAALLMAGLVLTACSASPGPASTRVRATAPSSQPAARTVVHTFLAYRADGTPAITSTRVEAGYCWDSSLAASGANAFRCFTDASGGGGQILDPCFAPATEHPASVLCVNDPWSGATTLRLTRALPPPVTGAPERPWAVELADGTHCVASTGTVPTVDGVNLSYHCADGTAAALGAADQRLWTAVRADPAGHTLTRTTVAGAWRT